MTHFPAMTVLHTPEHRGLEELRENAGLVAPFSVRSFTDTSPEWNGHNDNALRSAAFNADYLFIQEELLESVSEAARLAIGATLIRSNRLPDYAVFALDNTVHRIDDKEVIRWYAASLDMLDEVSAYSNPMLEEIK